MKHNLWRKFWTLCLGVICSFGVHAQSVLVAGTDFSCAGYENEAYVSVNEITGWLGIIQPQITVNLPLTPDADVDVKKKKGTFVDGKYYAVTNNAAKLDSFRLYDNNEDHWGLVLPKMSSQETMLTFQVSGLKPAANYTVEVEYCFVADYSEEWSYGYPGVNYNTGNQRPEYGSLDPKIKLIANPDQYNTKNGSDVGFSSNQKTDHGCATASNFTKSAVGADGKLTVYVNSSSQTSAIMLKSIKVYGEIDPQIYSLDGSEVCAGEFASLLLKNTYNTSGVTYQWYEDNRAISGANAPAYSFETPATVASHTYKLEVKSQGKTFTSNSLKVSTMKCCEVTLPDGTSVPASRKVIFKEDFGEFDIDSDPSGKTYKVWDFSDITNPKQVRKTTNTPFRAQISPAPLGCQFSSSGPLSDGDYCVAGVLTQYNGTTYNGTPVNGAKLEWAGRIGGPRNPVDPSVDHSGELPGCALFINCKPNTGGQSLYTRTIDNLCQNRQLFYECYITVFTNSANGTYNPVDVTIRLTEQGNTSNYSEARGTATIESEGGTGTWVKLAGDIYLERSDAIILDVINNSNVDQNGNDLVIDDIIIRACSAPQIKAYYDLTTFDTDTVTCSGDGVKVFAKVSEMLKQYFGGVNNTYFQYQYSTTPDVKTSWKNVGGITVDEFKDISSCTAFASAQDGDVIYFRVVAGGKWTMENTAESAFNPDDPCASYAISPAIPTYIECPTCKEPKEISITGGEELLCPGDQTTLTVTSQESTDNFSYTWYKGSVETNNIITSKTAATLPLSVKYDDVEGSQKYIVLVKDVNYPTATSCQSQAEFTVTAKEAPTVAISGGQVICEGETITKPVQFTFTGENTFSFTYSDGTTSSQQTLASGKTFSPTLPTAPGSSVTYSISALSDKYCEAATLPTTKATVTINPKPEVNLSADNDAICEGEGTIQLSAEVTQGASATWKKDGTAFTNSGLTKTLSAKSESGTYSIQATAEGCVSEVSEVTVVINEKPEILTLTSDKKAVCSGQTITFNSTVSDDGSGEYTWTGDDDVIGSGASVSLTKTVTVDTDVTLTLAYKNGCDAKETKSVTVTFYAIPQKPTVKDQAYCVDDTPSAIEGTASANATLNWYGTNETGGTASTTAPVPSTKKADVGKTFFYVSQTLNGCESERAMATVTVDDTLSPVITALPDFEVCEGTAIALNVEGTYKTTTWSGSGAAKLDATSIQSPTFSNLAEPGDYVVKVSVVDEKGCKGSSQKTITIDPLPITKLSALTNECVSDENEQTLTATITPAGVVGTGTWTGNVTKSSETSATYKPSTAGVGTHTVTYDFVSDKGCPAAQQSTSVEVYDLPTPTIKVSNASVCVSGNNSDEVTISTTGTVANGSFDYSVDNGGAVNATTGAFDPKMHSAGTYTISLIYTDPNGCQSASPATDVVVVHDLPTVVIDDTNPTELCYNGAAIEISTTVEPADGGSGVWTGTASATSNVFDPKTKTVGANTLTYTFTDKFQCKNVSNTYSIEVKKPATPTPGDDVNAMINNDVLNGMIPMEATMNAPADKLQWWYPENGKTIVSESTSYESPETAVGSYHYLVRSMLTVNGSGCYSDSVMVTTNISKCNAKAPKSADIYVCVGTELKEFTATQTSTLTNQKISWLTQNPVGKNGTEADSWILQDESTSFTPAASSVDVTAANDYVYYVAEYDGEELCWSPGTKVTLHVVDNPEVTIESPEHICAKGSETVPVTVNPQNGTLTPSVGTLDGFNWMPGDYEGDNEEVTFSYTVTSSPYADGTVCSTTETSQTTAHFMDKPSGSENIWLIGKIATIPNDLLDGTKTSTGKTMKWYDTQTKANELSPVTQTAAGSTYAPDLDALQTEVGSLKEFRKSYWITQTDDYSCESAPEEVTLHLLDCPWEAPTVDSIERCLNKPIGSLTAQEGAAVETMATGSRVSNWIWFDESGNEISGANSAVFIPTMVSNSEAKVTKFSVAYEAEEATSTVTCRSPKTDVIVTVLPLPEITFTEPGTICYTTEETKVRASSTSANGATTATWTITGDADAISDNGIFYAQQNGKNAGVKDYTITYQAKDTKGCINTQDIPISVLYLPPVETKGFYALTGQAENVTVSATSQLETGADVVWLSSETLINDQIRVGTGKALTTDDRTDVEINGKYYYARQFVDECYSEPTEAIVAIANCPIPSVVISDAEACLYSGAPELSAAGGEWAERPSGSVYHFYLDAEKTTELGNSADGKFTPSNITTDSDAKVYDYYVTESNANIQQFKDLYGVTETFACETKPVKVSVTMKKTLPPTVTAAPKEVCFKEEAPKFIATQYAGDIVWFTENPGEIGEPTGMAAGSGATFVPDLEDVGDHTVWGVALNNGCYSERTATVYTVNPIPEKPEVENKEICFEEEAVYLKAQGESGSVLNWYADAAKTQPLRASEEGYKPSVEAIDVYTYYVSQKVRGCESLLAEVTYEIKALPMPPSITEAPARLCEYDEQPTLTAEGERIRWYSDVNATDLLIEDASYVVNDMSRGTHKYYATQTVRGCEGATKMVVYQIYPTPENPKTVGASICAGDTNIPTLSTDGLTDKWYSDDQTTLMASGYTYTPMVEEVGSKDKIMYVQRERNGCVSEMVEAILHVIDVPSFSIGNDTVLCIYDPVATIQATDFQPVLTEKSFVEWKISNGTITKNMVDNAEHNITATNVLNVPGDYTISAVFACRYDETMTCKSNPVYLNYSIKAQPRKPIVFSKVICQGDEIDALQALGSPNVVWKSLSGTLPEEFHGPKYKFQAGSVLDTGTYKFEIYDMNIYDEENFIGCKSEVDTVDLVVAPGAHTKLFGRDSVCMGSIGESYYTQFEQTSQYFWTVTGDNLNYSKDATSTSVRYIDWQQPGVDTLTVYEQTWAGCEGFDTLIVHVAPAPVAHFTWSMPGSSNVIEFKDSTIQDSLWTTNSLGEPVPLPIEYTMAWNFGHQGSDPAEIDTVIPFNWRNHPIHEGHYLYGYNCPILTVTNDYGCTSTYTECIFVNLSSSLFVPTAFSPSNPAHAVRTFQPKGFNLQTCEISVYDKWGNLLWFSNEVKDGMFVGYWDGRYDGKPMQSDTYIWKMEATFLDGQVWDGFDNGSGKKVKYGNVMLLR